MVTKILFIVPPSLPLKEFIVNNNSKYQYYVYPYPPIGILSMAAYISKHVAFEYVIIDINTVLADQNKKYSSLDNLIQYALESTISDGNFLPDIVAISAVFNSNANYIEPISRISKLRWPNSIIVTGGGLPTNLYDYVFNVAPHIDALVIGEGEIPLLSLVQAENKKLFIEQSDEWLTREKCKNGKPKRASFVMNLDEIPELPYDKIDLKKYQSVTRFHGDIRDNPRVMPYMSSRGCPHKCVFCASNSVHGRKVRLVSAKRVIQDIHESKRKYHIDVIAFEDDHFLYDKKRAIEILKGISDLNLGIEFANGLTLYALDEELVKAMKEAGAKSLTLAIESGSERVLKDIIRKPLKLEMVAPVVKLLRKYNIYIRAFFVLGFPGETMEDINITIDFMKKTGFNWVGIMIATPIAGSKLYEICKENNYLISDSLEDYHFGKGNIITPNFTPDEIEDIRYNANLSVNFIENYDLKHGKPDIALIGFLDVINRVPDHAFAHYFASECYLELGDTDNAIMHREQYFLIIKESATWQGYATRFNLPLSITSGTL